MAYDDKDYSASGIPTMPLSEQGQRMGVIPFLLENADFKPFMNALPLYFSPLSFVLLISASQYTNLPPNHEETLYRPTPAYMYKPLAPSRTWNYWHEIADVDNEKCAFADDVSIYQVIGAIENLKWKNFSSLITIHRNDKDK